MKADAPLESQRIRADIRAGRLTGTSRGLAHGFVQCNLAIMPKAYAFYFMLYCQRNQRACPVLEVCDAGDPVQARASCRLAHRLRALFGVRRRREPSRPYRYQRPLAR